MSITFNIPCDCPRIVVACPICGADDYSTCGWQGRMCFDVHEDGCDMYLDCAAQERCAHEDLSVNMSNANARAVIEALGIDFDYSGQIALDEILGRATLRAALPADEPVPTVREGNMIACGRPEGYINERAGQLVSLALRAREDGYTYICWG